MLKNLSLKTKLISGFGFLALTSGIVGFTGYLSIYQLTGVVRDIGETNLPAVLGLTKMNEAQRIIDGAENTLLAINIDENRRNEVFKSFDEGQKLFVEGKKLYEDTGPTGEEAEKYKKFISAFDIWMKRHNEFVTLANAYEEAPSDESYNKMSDQALTQNEALLAAADNILEEIIAENVKDVELDIKDGIDEGQEDQLTSIIFAIGSIIFALTIGFFMSGYIAKSLNRVSGDLQESSIQVAGAADELSKAATDLSSASSEQASSVEETSSSLEEISVMIQNNVTHAEQAFNLSNKVKDISETGNQNMEKLEASMKEILLSNEKIEQLVKIIGNIGEKTQVMDEIVFQTKLLSFNASVEAERAGEHGRGFAVVAQEVGNLAQMSGKAAREIAEIVKDSIKNTELITAENKTRVETGNSYVLETGKNLKEIMGVASAVSNGAKQVLDASKDQANGIDQINNAMGQIDKATQGNAATAEEAASSSEELSAQTEVLNSVVEDLLKLVNGSNRSISESAIYSKKSRIIKSADKLVREEKKSVVKRISGNSGRYYAPESGKIKKSENKKVLSRGEPENGDGDNWDSI